MDWSKLNWVHGEHWWLVVLLAALFAAGLGSLFWWRGHVRQRLGDRALVERMTETVSVPLQVLKAGLAVLGVTLAMVALLRPQYGMRETELSHVGIDVAVLLDASQSMLVGDVPPDRFSASKTEIAKVLDGMNEGRVSLIPFYLVPFVQSPLTSDFESVDIYLDDLRLTDLSDPEMRGTSLGRALSKAISVLTAGENDAEGSGEHKPTDEDEERPELEGFVGSKHKAIVLFTDGEENEAIPEDLIKLAKQAGIRIYAVGVGKAEGGQVPAGESPGSAPLRSEDDQPVFSKVNEALLTELATTTGGKYFSFANQSVAEEVIAELEELEKKEYEAQMEKLGEDRFQFLLVPAILLLMLELALSERRRRTRTVAEAV